MKFTRVAFLFTLWQKINKGEVHGSGKAKAKWKLNPQGNYVKNVRGQHSPKPPIATQPPYPLTIIISAQLWALGGARLASTFSSLSC